MKPKRKIRLTKRSPKIENQMTLDRLDFIRKDMEEGKYNLTLPTIMIDYFDECVICGP